MLQTPYRRQEGDQVPQMRCCEPAYRKEMRPVRSRGVRLRYPYPWRPAWAGGAPFAERPSAAEADTEGATGSAGQPCE